MRCEKMRNEANVVNSDSFPERYDLIYESYYPQEFDVKYVKSRKR